ncbi:hypothetical protein PHMEG_00023864 [Phytophthora megakarya]|uniref:Uncharacterized protein n=1 Tax=Phytophthora megakarya TaxID=4795 RepID=A0A225VIB9_9STRA|nr:hypothetical protein PHMEG_00023864 [Phytophthora megakarya]
MSFAIYERKHWNLRDTVKRFFTRMTARLGKIKYTKERLRFQLALEHLRTVWFKYNKECADRADNLREGGVSSWPHVALVCWSRLSAANCDYAEPDTPSIHHRWLTRSANWCAEAALVDMSESCLEVLGPRIVPDSSLALEDIDTSWDRAFRGADEDEAMEEGKVG